MSKTTRTFSFDTETHKQLLRRLDNLPNGEKSKAVREGLRLFFGGTKPEPSRTEILAAIREGFADLRRRGVATEMVEEPGGEAEDTLKEALLGLGL